MITLFQVSLAPGTKVSSVTSVSSDIARMLKATNIRIVPNTEGLDTVGIEVPNLRKEKVRLKELMAQSEATNRMKLPLFLGKDASGEPLIADLAALPHMLIAGTTGSGKSVCMNAIIMGFLYTQKPSDLKLVLVDPKMVELSQFKDIPHLMCPVVTEMAKAAAILEWAVGKMDERYELLAEAGCRDISAYNALGWEELKDRLRPGTELEEARIPRKLPYMVFVIDELADLMMTNKEVEGGIELEELVEEQGSLEKGFVRIAHDDQVNVAVPGKQGGAEAPEGVCRSYPSFEDRSNMLEKRILCMTSKGVAAKGYEDIPRLLVHMSPLIL